MNNIIRTVKSVEILAKESKAKLIEQLNKSKKKYGSYHNINIEDLIKEEKINVLKAVLLQSRIELVKKQILD